MCRDRPWLGVLGLDAAIDRRLPRPRERGITMVIDTGLGLVATADMLEIASPHVDHWKLAFGTSALMPIHALRHKLELLAEYDILTYPGGTLLEAAIVQQHCRVYMRRARELGFRAVEISDGTIDLPAERRRRMIDCARDAGLVAITEVGKKDPAHQPEARELAEQALKDIEWGAAWVIVEARESGRGIGIYDEAGALRVDFLEEIARQLGDNTNRLIWEAPQKDQQAALVWRFGANVSLGNVAVCEVLALEALRSGLRYETLSPIAEREQAAGRWNPAVAEPPEQPLVTQPLVDRFAARGPPAMAEMRRGSVESVLEIGSRLSEAPSQRLVASAFAEEIAGQSELFGSLGLVDLAHCITLNEQGVIPSEAARPLVAALLDLRQDGTALTAEAVYGDLYTNREAQIAGQTSMVGWLGTSRARREALTTAYHLLLRDRLLELGARLAEFGGSLLVLARKHAESLMPDYTYLQAAQPTSFGHYLSGFAWPVLRDLQRLEALYARANLCPAGCGSSNGSVAFQDRTSLARRLGCAGPLAHARDAMWQADLAIEAMGLAVAGTIGLDRLAEDLMVFATAEFGFVRLSDRHARASKIMPQKRNPFALAFVRGLANRLIGEQAGVAASGRTPSGQMDSRMLPYEAVPAALRSAGQAAALMAEVVGGLNFDRVRARAALDDGTACASDLAERLCLGLKLDYRRAHGLVAGLMGGLEEQGRTLSSLTDEELKAACRAAGGDLPPVPDKLLQSALDPWSCLKARDDIGGAAPVEVLRQTHDLADSFARHEQWLEAARHRHATAEENLLVEARALAGRSP